VSRNDVLAPRAVTYVTVTCTVYIPTINTDSDEDIAPEILGKYSTIPGATSAHLSFDQRNLTNLPQVSDRYEPNHRKFLDLISSRNFRCWC
jgi:hypothetical protein